MPYGQIKADTERFPNLLHVSLSPCRRPYPGSRMELADCFLLHPRWPSPSLQRLGICQGLPAGSHWVVCDFGAATFALCYGPVSCLLFTDKSFYFRAFASRGHPQEASSITIRPNSQIAGAGLSPARHAALWAANRGHRDSRGKRTPRLGPGQGEPPITLAPAPLLIQKIPE